MYEKFPMWRFEEVGVMISLDLQHPGQRRHQRAAISRLREGTEASPVGRNGHPRHAQ